MKPLMFLLMYESMNWNYDLCKHTHMPGSEPKPKQIETVTQNNHLKCKQVAQLVRTEHPNSHQ